MRYKILYPEVYLPLHKCENKQQFEVQQPRLPLKQPEVRLKGNDKPYEV